MRSLLLLSLSMVAAGCAGTQAPESPAADVTTDAIETPRAEEAAAPFTVSMVLDGNVGTGAILCVGDPVGECAAQGAVAGDKQLLIELSGRLTGGQVTLAWTPASPATERLSFGVMLMGGEGAECAGVDLGTVLGASPLVIDVADPGRDLCPGEVVHAWVSGERWGTQGPAYYQLDLDQPFHLEGALTLAPSSSP